MKRLISILVVLGAISTQSAFAKGISDNLTLYNVSFNKILLVATVDNVPPAIQTPGDINATGGEGTINKSADELPSDANENLGDTTVVDTIISSPDIVPDDENGSLGDIPNNTDIKNNTKETSKDVAPVEEEYSMWILYVFFIVLAIKWVWKGLKFICPIILRKILIKIKTMREEREEIYDDVSEINSEDDHWKP